MTIRIAAVQIDYNPAAFIDVTDFLKEPSKWSDGETGYGLAYLPLDSDKVKNILSEVKRSYSDFMNKKIKIILEFCAKKGVDLVVFSEYSIPAECLPRIKEISKSRNINVIAGSHSVVAENYEYYKKIEMAGWDKTTKEEMLRKAISPIFHASGEVTYVEKFIQTQRMDHDFTPGELWKIIKFKKESKEYNVAVFICIDFLEEKNRNRAMLLDGLPEIDFIVVPAYTTRTDYFENLATNYSQGYKKPVVFVNAYDKGGTRIYCHIDLATKQQLYTVNDDNLGTFKLSEKEEGIIIADIDPKKQYSEKPTGFIPYDSSLQKGVYPFVYSRTIEDFEKIYNEVNDCNSIQGKRNLLDNYTNKINQWRTYSKIYERKISFLFKELMNFNEDQIDFYFGCLYLDDNIDMMDQWRLKEISKVDDALEDILKAKKLNQYEQEMIYKLRIYYSSQKIRLEDNKLISKRKDAIEMAKYSRQKILWIKNGFLSKQLLDEFMGVFNIIDKEADTIASITTGEFEGANAIVVFVDITQNPLIKIGKKFYNKCILICDKDVLLDDLPPEVKGRLLYLDKNVNGALKTKLIEVLERNINNEFEHISC